MLKNSEELATQTETLRSSPWKLWPESLQSFRGASTHKSELVEIQVSESSRLRSHTAVTPAWQRALAALCSPNRVCISSSGGKWLRGWSPAGQHNPSYQSATPSVLIKAFANTNSLENTTHLCFSQENPDFALLPLVG